MLIGGFHSVSFLHNHVLWAGDFILENPNTSSYYHTHIIGRFKKNF